MVIEQNPLFIITTVVFGAFTFILLFAIIALWVFMKPEGRFFFRQTFGGGGLDCIRHEPVSNQLVLDSVKWNGETFQNKQGIYYPLRQLLNPRSESQKFYNNAISTAARWKGSKRPVILTTDLMSFAVSAEFYAAVEKAKNSDEYNRIKPFLTDLSKLLTKSGVEHFSFIESFNIADIQEIVKDVGPRKIRDSYKKGVTAEQLKNTKLGDGVFGSIPLWLIFIGLVAFVGVVGYAVLNSGLVPV